MVLDDVAVVHISLHRTSRDNKQNKTLAGLLVVCAAVQYKLLL